MMSSNFRITLAQINPTVGDIKGNIALMQAAAQKAVAAGATVLVFPELSLSAYYPADLPDEPEFLAQIEQGLSQLLECTRATPGLHWVLGAPLRREGPGKSLQNSLLVLADGAIRLRYAKQLLPTYNIFDERRHFEPGPDVAKVLRIGQMQIGFLICEDGWNDEGREYAVNPFERLADAAPDLVVSINASPSSIGKRELRHSLFAAASKRHGLPMLYVNQVGGHDQIVFDGASFAGKPEAGVIFEAQRFVEDICTLTLALAVETLGSENVVGITMPSDFSSEGSVSDSVALCRNLGIRLIEHPIRELVAQYGKGFSEAFLAPLQGLPLENLQARVRGTILMEYSNAFGHLLLTTGNKSEISVGYCTHADCCTL